MHHTFLIKQIAIKCCPSSATRSTSKYNTNTKKVLGNITKKQKLFYKCLLQNYKKNQQISYIKSYNIKEQWKENKNWTRW